VEEEIAEAVEIKKVVRLKMFHYLEWYEAILKEVANKMKHSAVELSPSTAEY